MSAIKLTREEQRSLKHSRVVLRRLVGRLNDELYDERFAHRQTESARNKLARKYLLVCNALDQIKTLPRGGRAKRIAGSTLSFVDNL